MKKLIEKIKKYFNIGNVAKNVSWIILQNIYTMILGLLTTSIVARSLGTSGYGTLNFCLSYVALFSFIAIFGTNHIILKDLSEKKYDAGIVLGTNFGVRVVLSLISLIILPISAFIVKSIVGKSQKYFKKQQDYLGHVNGQVEEIYSGLNIVKVFNSEERANKEFKKANNELYHSGWKSQFLSGLMFPVMNFVANVRLCWSCSCRWIFSNSRKNNCWKYTKFYTI